MEKKIIFSKTHQTSSESFNGYGELIFGNPAGYLQTKCGKIIAQ